MHTDRLRHLADVIERQPHTGLHEPSGFNMGNWTHNCGTPACIAGWANSVQDDSDIHLGDMPKAREWLGITGPQAEELFTPGENFDEEDGPIFSWSDITPSHAAAVLRHLADTGEVDWSMGASE